MTFGLTNELSAYENNQHIELLQTYESNMSIIEDGLKVVQYIYRDNTNDVKFNQVYCLKLIFKILNTHAQNDLKLCGSDSKTLSCFVDNQYINYEDLSIDLNLQRIPCDLLHQLLVKQ